MGEVESEGQRLANEWADECLTADAALAIDAALRRAKAEGRNRFAVHEPRFDAAFAIEFHVRALLTARRARPLVDAVLRTATGFAVAHIHLYAAEIFAHPSPPSLRRGNDFASCAAAASIAFAQSSRVWHT